MWPIVAKFLEWVFEDVIGEISFVKPILSIAKKNKLGRAGGLNAIIDLAGASVIGAITLFQIWKNPPGLNVMPSINKWLILVVICLLYVFSENIIIESKKT